MQQYMAECLRSSVGSPLLRRCMTCLKTWQDSSMADGLLTSPIFYTLVWMYEFLLDDKNKNVFAALCCTIALRWCIKNEKNTVLAEIWFERLTKLNDCVCLGVADLVNQAQFCLLRRQTELRREASAGINVRPHHSLGESIDVS